MYGRGFVASMDLLGLFVGHADRAAVPVKITSEASLELITPEAKIHGDVQVIMSNTRFNIDSRVALLFMYTPPLSVRGIKPCKDPRMETLFPFGVIFRVQAYSHAASTQRW